MAPLTETAVASMRYSPHGWSLLSGHSAWYSPFTFWLQSEIMPLFRSSNESFVTWSLSIAASVIAPSVVLVPNSDVARLWLRAQPRAVHL